MEKIIILSILGVLLATAYFPLAESWVVFDSRNDMLAMSSETDNVAVTMDSSEEESKKARADETIVENKSESDSAESEEVKVDKQKEIELKKIKGDADEAAILPKEQETIVGDDDTTEPITENGEEVNEKDKSMESETTTEKVVAPFA